jgi:hypothetical protein
LVRSGGTVSFLIDGVSLYSTAFATPMSSVNVKVSLEALGALDYVYLDNIRLWVKL